MNAVTAFRPVDRSTGRVAVAVAALGVAGVCLSFAGMQVALAAGAPLGEHVWGGAYDRVLPTGMRVAAAGAAVALPAMAAVVARRAGLVGRPARWLTPATCIIAGFLALNTVGNLASSSSVERFAFAPAAAAASVLTTLVAFGARRS